VVHFSSPNLGNHFLRAVACSTVRWQVRGHWLRWKDCWTGWIGVQHRLWWWL